MIELKPSSRNLKRIALGGWLIVSLAVNLAVASQPRQRIHGEIYDGPNLALSGNVRPSIRRAQDLGPVSASLPLTRMSMHFSMTPSQNSDLQQLLRLQQTRHSAQFHKWLTPEEYADRFGLNQKDIQKVTTWLESQGFTNIEAARSRNVIMFDGTAGQTQAAFHTNIHSFTLGGYKHYAITTEPEIPVALGGIVEGIRGLHDFHPKPHSHPHFTSSISGNHFLVPDDLATIYDLQALYGSGITGAGVTIGIPGQTDIALSDVAAFRAAANLPASAPTVVLTGTDPGTSKNDLGEAELDVEWAGGIAKGAQIVYVNSKDVFTSLTYAITNNLANVIAVTYGSCEADTGAAEIDSLNKTLQQANAQGITIAVSAGDDGPADCDGDTTDPNTIVSIAARGLSVDFPASSPYVTSVGGTSLSGGSTYWKTTNDAFSGSAISYIPETAWNDTTAEKRLAASGGGVSTLNTKPTWQTGTGVPNDGSRDVPDVSLVASPNNEEGGYIICSAGSCVNGFRMANQDLDVTGGTSASSPDLAAIVALLVQKTGTSQGNINPNLYTLASISIDAFHDITSGNNIVPCKGGTPNCSSTAANVNGTLGYSAGIGYDRVTGLGSIDGDRLLSEWGADIQSSINPTSLSVTRGASGTATVNVKETDYTGSVHFTCSVASTLTNTTCSVPGTVSGTGSTALTITTGATAREFPWRISHGPRGNDWLYLLTTMMLAGSAAFAAKQRKMRVWPAAAAVVLLTGLSGCGSGGSSGTSTSAVIPAETGVVTVVATSGSLTSTSTVSVTVQ